MTRTQTLVYLNTNKRNRPGDHFIYTGTLMTIIIIMKKTFCRSSLLCGSICIPRVYSFYSLTRSLVISSIFSIVRERRRYRYRSRAATAIVSSHVFNAGSGMENANRENLSSSHLCVLQSTLLFLFCFYLYLYFFFFFFSLLCYL